MQHFDRGPTVLPIGVQVVHVGAHRARAIEGNQRNHVVERVRLERANQRPHGIAFELKDPDRVARLEEDEGLLIVERDRVDIESLPRARLHQLKTALDDREVAQPEEVHLKQTQ